MAMELFDPQYYAAANPDLAAVGIDTPEELRQHFDQVGLSEGRRFSAFIDLKFYKESYSDIAASGLTTNQQVFDHLQQFGIKENRRVSPILDLNYYAANNPDLLQDFGNNYEQLFEHLINRGINEGRKIVSGLDLRSYLTLNPDVNAVVGGSLVGALQHIEAFGLKEKRQGIPQSFAGATFQIQAAQRLYEALASWSLNPSNTTSILQLLAPDIDWKVHGDADRIPFAGQYVYQAGVQSYLQQLSRTLLQPVGTPLEFVQDGDRVAVRTAQTATVLNSGETFQRDVVDVLSVRSDGLISSFESYANNFALVQALGGVTPALAGASDPLTGKPAAIDESADTEQARAVAEGMWQALIANNFNSEDPKSFLNLAAENIEWSFAVGADPNLLPYSEYVTGIGGVVESVGMKQAAIAQAGKITIEESFAEGNRVLVHLKERGANVRATGEKYDQDIFSWMTVKDGKVQSAQSVIDTNLTLEGLRLGARYPFPTQPRRTPPYLVTTSLLTNQLLTFDEQGNFTGVLGDASQAESGLTNPSGVTFGPDGDIYVNSRATHQVMRFDGVSGAFQGVFGQADSTNSGLLYPTGIKFGPDGNLYVASGWTSQILKYSGTTGQFLGVFAQRQNGFANNTITPQALSALGLPADLPDFTVIQFGPDGDLYVGSLLDDPDGNPANGAGTVRRYAGPNSANPGEFKGVFGETFNVAPNSLVFGPDSNLYINKATGQVLSFAGPTTTNPGQSLGVFADVGADLRSQGVDFDILQLLGMEFSPDGNLQTGSVAINLVSGAAPTITSQLNIYGGPNSANPGQYAGTFGEASTRGSGMLIPTTPVFAANSFERPYFIVSSNTDPNGFFGSDETDAFAAYDKAGNFIGFFNKYPGEDNPQNGIGGTVLAPNGHILASSQNSNQVQQYDALTGEYRGVFGDASPEGSGLEFPAGITLGPDNNVYVSSLGTERILKYDGITGESLGVFAKGNTEDGISERFTDLAFGPDGNLYVGFNPEFGNPGLARAKVRVYSGATGELVREITGLDFVAAIDFGPDGNLYVSDDPTAVFQSPTTIVPVAPQKPGRVVTFDLQGNQLRSFNVGVANAGNISFSPDGLLYLSNPGGGTVTVYDPVSGSPLDSIEVPAITGGTGRPTGVNFFVTDMPSPVL